jgi:hydrogenase small subunit
MAPIGVRSQGVEPDTSKIRLGPLEKIYLIWMVGASCDGCTVAVTGATHPRVEHLLAGIIPGLPRVELIHTVVSTEVGPEWTHNPLRHHLGGLDHGRVHRR